MPLPTDVDRMKRLVRELDSVEDGGSLRGAHRRPQPRLPVVGPDGVDASDLAGVRRASVDMAKVPAMPQPEFDLHPEMPPASVRPGRPAVYNKPPPRDSVPDEAIAASVRDERRMDAARASASRDAPAMPPPAPVRVPRPVVLPKPTPMDSVPDDVIARDARAIGMEERGELELPGMPAEDDGLVLGDGMGDRHSVGKAVASLPKPKMPTLRRPSGEEPTVTKAVEAPPREGPEIDMGDGPTKAAAATADKVPAAKQDAKSPVKAKTGPLAASQQKIADEEKQRRSRLAGQYRAESAQVQAELNQWTASGRVVPEHILNAKRAVIDRLNKQADEMEASGKATRAPSQVVSREFKDQLRAFRDSQTSDRDAVRLADDIIAENSRSQRNRMSEEEADEIRAMARGGNKASVMEALRQERRDGASRRRAASMAAAADNAVNYNLARMHPAQRMAFMFRTLAEGQDPDQKMAAAFAIDPRLAQLMQQQRSAESAAEAQRLAAEQERQYRRDMLSLRGREVDVQEQEARDKRNATDPSHQLGMNHAAINRALAAESPEQQLQLMKTALQQTGEMLDSPALTARAKSLITDHYARRGDTRHPMVREKVQELAQRGRYPEFFEWVNRNLGWDDRTARTAYHNSRTGFQQWWDTLPSMPQWNQLPSFGVDAFKGGQQQQL